MNDTTDKAGYEKLKAGTILGRLLRGSGTWGGGCRDPTEQSRCNSDPEEERAGMRRWPGAVV